MRIHKSVFIVGFVIALTLFFELVAHADESNQATTVTFNQPIQVPGRTLPAGTYLFMLADSESDRSLVQIFNADGTVLYATVQAVAAERQEPSGSTVITVAEQGSGKPDALVSWFYPGRETGQEFVYSKRQQTELAQDKKQTIVADQHATLDSNTGSGY
jgi:hypothetical protein